jgi:hypothetical protein
MISRVQGINPHPVFGLSSAAARRRSQVCTDFELPVPRAMQGRPKAIIDGFGCMPPSLDYLRLPLLEISEGGPKRNLGTEALSRAEPEVGIHFPPAASQLRTWAFRRCLR